MTSMYSSPLISRGYVSNAINGLVSEAALGAILTGFVVLLFLRDWRGALIVVANIPFALFAAVLLLWATGQTINIMTLGGLALAVGVLVDEATVEVENIHTQLLPGVSRARAVLEACRRTVTRPFALDALCSGGVRSVFLYEWSGTTALRPAVSRGRLCHGRLLLPVEQLGSCLRHLDHEGIPSKEKKRKELSEA